MVGLQVNSFDLYGYDILLDSSFRPWLIEINSSPSMARENDLDYQVSQSDVYMTIDLISIDHVNRAGERCADAGYDSTSESVAL